MTELGVVGSLAGVISVTESTVKPSLIPSRLATDLLVFAPNFLVVIAQALNSLRYFHEQLNTTR